MANIIISFVSCYGDTFYKNLSDELIKNGNNIYFVNWSDYIENINGRYNLKHQFSFMIDDIFNFKPDVVFNFNFSLPVEILDKVQAKICIIDADSVRILTCCKLIKLQIRIGCSQIKSLRIWPCIISVYAFLSRIINRAADLGYWFIRLNSTSYVKKSTLFYCSRQCYSGLGSYFKRRLSTRRHRHNRRGRLHEGGIAI